MLLCGSNALKQKARFIQSLLCTRTSIQRTKRGGDYINPLNASGN